MPQFLADAVRSRWLPVCMGSTRASWLLTSAPGRTGAWAGCPPPSARARYAMTWIMEEAVGATTLPGVGLYAWRGKRRADPRRVRHRDPRAHKDLSPAGPLWFYRWPVRLRRRRTPCWWVRSRSLRV